MTYAVILILLIASEVVYLRVASRLGITDRPDTNSSHLSTTLRGGGIVFLLGTWLYAAFFGMTYVWFLAGVTLAGTVSFIDDVRSLPISFRFLVQATGVGLTFMQFAPQWHPEFWLIAVALVAGVGIINAFNFMDGINGMTGAYTMAVLIPLIYLNGQLDFIGMPLLSTTFISAAIFCFFNFRKKAVCFCGDVGSITVAFILLFSLGMLIVRTGDYSYLVFMAVYGVDSTFTIIHRLLLRENPLTRHRKHAYQLMANELHLPHLAVSLIYMGIQLMISAGRLLLPVNHYLYLGISVGVLSVAYLLFMKKYYRLHQGNMNVPE